MSQPSSTQSSPHPVLQAALSSLDVQLEVELAQYRCHQTVRHSPPHTAYRASQDQGSETSGETLAATESVTAIPLPRQTQPHFDNLVHSTTPIASVNNSQVEVPEPVPCLTLEAYLEFSRSGWRDSAMSQDATKSKFRQRLCNPLAIAAAVSLFLSIPLSYVIILYLVSLTGWGLDTCVPSQAPKPFYFCNSSSSDNRYLIIDN